jgi:hypothetical protein
MKDTEKTTEIRFEELTTKDTGKAVVVDNCHEIQFACFFLKNRKNTIAANQ